MNISAPIRNLAQLPPEQLLLRATQTLPPWVALVLAIALAWQLGKLVWLLVPQSEATVAEVVRPAAVQASAGPTSDAREDAQKIIRGHLFGSFNAATAPPPKVAETQIENASETTLNLKLLGTVASGEDEESMAIIVDGKGDSNVYFLNDPIQQGVSLHSVFPEWVHIKRGGKIERLSLPMEIDLKGMNTPTRNTRRSTRTARSTRNSATNKLSSALADAGPKKLTDLIRPQPVFADGKQLGYRVYPGRNRQQFSKLGLKPGDLVTQINGSPLNDPAKGLEIFRALEDSTQVSVTVERNGQSETVVLDTSALSGAGASPR